MKRSRFTEELGLGVLRHQDGGAKAGELTCKRGACEATPYDWGAEAGGTGVSEGHGLEDEDTGLERHLVDAMRGKPARTESSLPGPPTTTPPTAPAARQQDGGAYSAHLTALGQPAA